MPGAHIEPIPDAIPKYTQLFIDNEWTNASKGKTIATIDPATLAKIADVQLGDEEDVDRAVAAAKRAFALGSPWRRMDASQRGGLIAKLADSIERETAFLAVILQHQLLQY
jgi:aldehyde dehydrogenase (NAD+)